MGSTPGSRSAARAAERTACSRSGRTGRGDPRALRDPGVLLDAVRGREDFRFPASHGVLELPPSPPDVLHLHNLHGGYFDLRALPELAGAAADRRDDARRVALHRSLRVHARLGALAHRLRLVSASRQLSRAARGRDRGQLAAQGGAVRALAAARRVPVAVAARARAAVDARAGDRLRPRDPERRRPRAVLTRRLRRGSRSGRPPPSRERRRLCGPGRADEPVQGLRHAARCARAARRAGRRGCARGRRGGGARRRGEVVLGAFRRAGARRRVPPRLPTSTCTRPGRTTIRSRCWRRSPAGRRSSPRPSAASPSSFAPRRECSWSRGTRRRSPPRSRSCSPTTSGAHAWASAAAADARARFSLDRQVDAYLDLYADLC